jgi:hypothetical protein
MIRIDQPMRKPLSASSRAMVRHFDQALCEIRDQINQQKSDKDIISSPDNDIRVVIVGNCKINSFEISDSVYSLNKEEIEKKILFIIELIFQNINTKATDIIKKANISEYIKKAPEEVQTLINKVQNDYKNRYAEMGSKFIEYKSDNNDIVFTSSVEMGSTLNISEYFLAIPKKSELETGLVSCINRILLENQKRGFFLLEETKKIIVDSSGDALMNR